ncbi:MAG: exopolysaccharide biosynthesis polyprenyl glycosylphosphotransferase [Oscillospiraceae bacterium]|nr:exopolysaccharide biosynthesis polyprenyl glycosylphosphotransferase [Oscillospiraceae bacterium]
MGAKRRNLMKFIIITVDLALIVASYVITFLIRFGELPEYNTQPFVAALPFVALSFLAYADIFGLLKIGRSSRRQVMAQILKLVFMQALTTTTIAYFMQGFAFPRTVLLGSAVVQAALLATWNWIMLSLRNRYTVTTNAMIIGGAEDARTLTEKMAELINSEKINIKYVFGPGDEEQFFSVIRKSRVDEVFICTGLSENLKIQVILMCMNLKKVVYLVPEVSEIALLNAHVINIDDTPLILLDHINLSFEQRLFKRVFDLAATLLALPLLLPFLLMVAAGVKLSSPGRVLYSQERVTGGGRLYRIQKFRTMYEDAELLTGPVISSENDTRVTPLGRFLRRYHIDEFPQLINVIKGEMSLVGPRSERPFFVEQFSRDIDGYTIRNNVKAGLTGYAQIFGNYDTEAGMKLKYDILYIRNYSLLLDVKLILQTFGSILFRRGGNGGP